MERKMRCGRAVATCVVALWSCGSASAGQQDACVADVAPHGVAEGVKAVAITSHSAYWVNLFGIGLVGGDAANGAGLLVIRGEVHNDTKGALRHVKLAFELLDARGRVVAVEHGYNRSSEMLREIDSPIPWNADDPPQAAIPYGGTDTFRMLFLRNETPPFRSYRVRVVEAEVSDER
jgi:hypothetical protein